MGGSPLASLLVILLLLAGASYPLVWIDQRAAAAPEVREMTSKTVPAAFRAKFSHPPTSAQLKAGETMLAQWQQADGLDWQASVELPIFEGLSEPRLIVQWPAGAAEAATQVFLAPEELDEKTLTFWATDGLDELLHFQWQPPATP